MDKLKTESAELIETLEKILRLNHFGYCIIAIKLNDKVKECLELFYSKAVFEDSKYFIYNTEYGIKSGSFTENIYSEYVRPDYIIEL